MLCMRSYTGMGMCVCLCLCCGGLILNLRPPPPPKPTPSHTITTEEAEAMHQCNDSVYGLAAAVFTADSQRADRVCRGLRVGIVWKNCCQPAFVQAPWGGILYVWIWVY
ncbi:aldehyde dehydrogenase family protein, partial [archaeon]